VKGLRDREPGEPDARRWLDDDEDVIAVLDGEGAGLRATRQRIVIVRDGSPVSSTKRCPIVAL